MLAYRISAHCTHAIPEDPAGAASSQAFDKHSLASSLCGRKLKLHISRSIDFIRGKFLEKVTDLDRSAFLLREIVAQALSTRK
jgi:hypothetical protein